MNGIDPDEFAGIDRKGRYDSTEVATLTAPDGREICYRRRRFLPRPDALPLLVEVVVEHGDRLDQLAAKHLGDPEQAWRICDANDTMNPFDHISEPGSRLRVPIPSFGTEQ